MSETTARAALIAEARKYADAIQGGETENWMRLVACVDNLATALAESGREIGALAATIARIHAMATEDTGMAWWVHQELARILTQTDAARA